MCPVAKKTIFERFEPDRDAHARRHMVAVVAFDGVVLGDLAMPCEVFGRVRNPEGRSAYDVRICSLGREVRSEHVTLKAPWRLSSVRRADTVIARDRPA
jgi:hypothetical protein